MKLEQYTSLNEKDCFFNRTTINTAKQFDTLIGHKTFDENTIFRGVKESKFKLYSSAQRLWISMDFALRNRKFTDLISESLNEISKNRSLNLYLSSNGIQTNDLYRLVFLQHYSGATPLIDFTSNKLISFFFGLEGLDISPWGFDGIDNYFSIYALNYIKIPKIDEIYFYGMENGKQALKENQKEYPNLDIDASILENFEKFTKWLNGINCLHLAYLPNPLKAKKTRNIQNKTLYWSNPNLIAQDGCFILNNDDMQPLERSMSADFNTLIQCFDVHKSLRGYIKEAYLKNIDRKYLFPDFYQIGKDIKNHLINTFI